MLKFLYYTCILLVIASELQLVLSQSCAAAGAVCGSGPNLPCCPDTFCNLTSLRCEANESTCIGQSCTQATGCCPGAACNNVSRVCVVERICLDIGFRCLLSSNSTCCDNLLCLNQTGRCAQCANRGASCQVYPCCDGFTCSSQTCIETRNVIQQLLAFIQFLFRLLGLNG